MTGFTYNGVHCSEFGLEYIPDRSAQWFPDPEYDVYDKDVEWMHGGYYYGSRATVRKFQLKCFFEEIDTATRQAIKNWVRRDSTGVLIFDEIPFIYWLVRPGKIPVGNWYLDNNETHSGTVDLTFNAYSPFGRLLRKANTSGRTDDHSEDYCNLISADDMPAEPITSDTSFDIYNPGTEPCGLYLELSGSVSHPFRFFNESNGTKCEFNSLPSNNLRILVNGDSGYVTTYAAGSESTENGFAYHNKGVIRLNPNCGKSGVEYTYLGRNGTLYAFELDGCKVSNDLAGAEFKLEGVNTVFTVVSVSRGVNRVYCSADGQPTVPASGTCSYKTLNHIVIQEKTNNTWSAPTTLQLTYIHTDYNPRAL